MSSSSSSRSQSRAVAVVAAQHHAGGAAGGAARAAAVRRSAPTRRGSGKWTRADAEVVLGVDHGTRRRCSAVCASSRWAASRRKPAASAIRSAARRIAAGVLEPALAAVQARAGAGRRAPAGGRRPGRRRPGPGRGRRSGRRWSARRATPWSAAKPRVRAASRSEPGPVPVPAVVDGLQAQRVAVELPPGGEQAGRRGPGGRRPAPGRRRSRGRAARSGRRRGWPARAVQREDGPLGPARRGRR